MEHFKQLKESKNFTEDSIRKYTGEGIFCYLLNRVMRNFEKGLIKLAYYIGPLLFGLNKYALEHPDKCLNENTTLYRKLTLNPLDKYIYKFSVGHIICFPSLTSTSILKDQFAPTKLAKNINKIKNDKENSEEIKIEMIIKYKHEEGNITPALNIVKLSNSKNEEERLIFPFTFFRINDIKTKIGEKNSYIFNMEIINRKKIIEYDLKEGKQYYIEGLEEFYDENKPLIIDDAKQKTFQVKEKEKKKEKENNSFCIII